MNNRFSFQGPEKKPQLIVLPECVRPRSWKKFPDLQEGYADVSSSEGIISLSAGISRERIFEIFCEMIDRFSEEEVGITLSLHNGGDPWSVYESDLVEKTVLLSKLLNHEDLLTDEGGATVGIVDSKAVLEIGRTKLITLFKEEGNLRQERAFLEQRGVPQRNERWLGHLAEMDVFSSKFFRKRIESLMHEFSLEEGASMY